MRLKHKFKKDFKDALELWTGEDGMLMSIASLRSEDGVRQIMERIKIRNPDKPFDRQRIKSRFAFREWPEPGFYFWKGDRGKVWGIGDEPTEFPVFEYELEQPV